jgi:hypothetical protein
MNKKISLLIIVFLVGMVGWQVFERPSLAQNYQLENRFKMESENFILEDLNEDDELSPGKVAGYSTTGIQVNPGTAKKKSNELTIILVLIAIFLITFLTRTIIKRKQKR